MTGKLSERAMLVSLHIGGYAGMMHDRTVTDEVAVQYKAENGAGHYNKRLIAAKFLNGVSSAQSQARTTHKLLTLPWEDDGTRILTTKGFMQYQEALRNSKQKVETEVKNFVAGLPEYITEATHRLGKMFNAEDYPNDSELTSKFSFDIEFKSLPEAADFRAKLSDDAVKGIVKDIEKRCNARLENAVNDVFERVVPLLKKMVERLREYTPADSNGKAKGTIRDSLIYNIFELAEAMPILNVTDDLRIEALRQALVSELVEPASPEILRSDSKARAHAISAAEKMLKKVEAYLKP